MKNPIVQQSRNVRLVLSSIKKREALTSDTSKNSNEKRAIRVGLIVCDLQSICDQTVAYRPVFDANYLAIIDAIQTSHATTGNHLSLHDFLHARCVYQLSHLREFGIIDNFLNLQGFHR